MGKSSKYTSEYTYNVHASQHQPEVSNILFSQHYETIVVIVLVEGTFLISRSYLL